MPPPPEAALSMTGKPIFLAAADGFLGRVAASRPGRSGTPAALILSRAAVFEPIARIALAGGPMNAMPARSHASGSAGFSLRKP